MSKPTRFASGAWLDHSLPDLREPLRRAGIADGAEDFAAWLAPRIARYRDEAGNVG